MSDFDPRGFASDWWKHQFRETSFVDALLDLGEADGFDFSGLGTDHYDSSLELYDVTDGVELNEAQQRLIFDCGFQRCYVNRATGQASLYVFNQEFSVITNPGKCSSHQRR